MVSVVVFLGCLLCKPSEASCFANHFALFSLVLLVAAEMVKKNSLFGSNHHFLNKFCMLFHGKIRCFRKYRVLTDTSPLVKNIGQVSRNRIIAPWYLIVICMNTSDMVRRWKTTIVWGDVMKI